MICYLGLGSNIGDRREQIARAVFEISTHPEIEKKKTSSIIETKPVGYLDQPDFMNCVMEIDTTLESLQLLDCCRKIEQKMGRVRQQKWGPRKIDIDILFYGNMIIKTPELILPHPEILNRNFILRSLSEICPEFVHPETGKMIKEMFRFENEDSTLNEL